MKYHEKILVACGTSLESEHKDIITKYPDAAYVMKQEQEVLGNVVNLASSTAVA